MKDTTTFTLCNCNVTECRQFMHSTCTGTGTGILVCWVLDTRLPLPSSLLLLPPLSSLTLEVAP